jgi:hypothetical protein
MRGNRPPERRRYGGGGARQHRHFAADFVDPRRWFGFGGRGFGGHAGESLV